MRAQRVIVVMAAALALVFGWSGSVPAAAAEQSAAIKGQVLSWMDPIGYARVTVYDASTGAAIRSALTDGGGNYLDAWSPVIPLVAGEVRAPDHGNGASSTWLPKAS